MIIDAHQHFWNYDPIRDSWIDDSMSVLRQDFSPEAARKLLRAKGISGCVAIQADQSEEETRFLLTQAERYDVIKGVVGWVDLRGSKVEERLEYYKMNSFFCGVRHIVQAEPVGFMEDKNFRNGISKLQDLQLTYDILIYPQQLTETLSLVRAFPELKFVIDHIAKPDIKNIQITDWKQAIKEIAGFDNVYCKISGMVTEAGDDLRETVFSPYLDVVTEAFGCSRLMFGSDWPVCLLKTDYNHVFELIDNYYTDFSQFERAQIFGQNAIEFYDLSV
ncbi:amidohydrolase family protein [Robertkochia solimangrovi]|uniref:amidohydrolase family protein n=1 Tax=Robertkochia solimangrovi TaxID=2213046 RepID=UPI00117E2237|nr:amidohydrolase family protein [Robertkochia solimangrovi]TRZ42301.1 amidohydrolase [Robertkochia solimangrovi]